MSVGGIDSFHTTFASLLFKGIRVSASDVYRPSDANEVAVKTRWLNAVERALSEHEGQIAGIILEPLIQGAGGMLLAPNGFLKELAALAKRWKNPSYR